MKRIISNGALAAVAAGALLLSSCSDRDMFNPNYKAEEYAANWGSKFGQIDPNQDWSMATKVTAKVNVPNLPGYSLMKIYNYSPLAPECRVLGVTNLNNGVGEVSFDALKGSSSLFVTVEQNGDYKLFGSYNVEDGQLCIGNVVPKKATAKTRSASDVTIGETVELSGITYDVILKDTYTWLGKAYTWEQLIAITQSVYDKLVNKAEIQYIGDQQIPFTAASIVKMKTVSNEWNTWQEFDGISFENPQLQANVTVGGTESKNIKLTYLNNVETSAAEPWKLGWGYELYGPGAFFQESGKYYKDPKYGKLYDRNTLDGIEKGFSITTKGGEISLPFIYGVTDIVDQFGYVFYKEGEDPLAQPHYILMDHGRPQHNIYWEKWQGTAVGQKELSQAVSDLPYWGEVTSDRYIGRYNTEVYGTEYKLVYFDENGNATYDIPAGLNVVFFICPVKDIDSRDKSNYNTDNFNYSLPELNKRIKHLYDNTESPSFEEGNNEQGHEKARGAVKAVSWNFKGRDYLGFEDGGGDEDLNDIVFWVEGNYEKDGVDIVVPDPNPEDPVPTTSTITKSFPWILACEDLGDTDDYDFNDIVLEVQRVDEYTETSIDNVLQSKEYKGSKLVVKCLAAGGTLPANIYYNDKLIDEAHAMLGATSTSQMINTINGITNTPKEYVVEESINADWNLSDNISKFKIVVTNKENDGTQNAVVVEAPKTGEAPQMIVLPGDWEWPTERTSITEAYPHFQNWNSNSSLTDWTDTWIPSKVIKRNK